MDNSDDNRKRILNQMTTNSRIIAASVYGDDALRVTLDPHVLVTESRQVDNTTNTLRRMLLALVIGIILMRTLLRDRRTRWQQLPFLLTASPPVKEDRNDESEKKDPAP